MIATIATVWAIAFAAYNFIYDYFAARYLDRAYDLADKTYQKGPPKPGEETHMIRRLRRNYRVFVGYAIAGIVSVTSIGSSAFAIAYDSFDWYMAAKAIFGAAILLHLGLFTFEIGTSACQVKCLQLRLQGTQ